MMIYGSVDLGGTKIAGMAATADEEVVARQTIPTRAYEGPEAVLERVAVLLRNLAQASGEQLGAVGMGFPGLLDLEEGVVEFLPNLYTQWRGVAVRDPLTTRIGCPVYVLNDARMATLGELAYGRGQGRETMAFFTLGTGIGGGVVVSGDLHLGRLGAAGELGHQTILPNGPRCGCGNQGCLETLASGPAIAAEGVRLLLSGQAPGLFDIVDGDPARVTPRVMTEAAEAGDEAVHEALVRAAEYLGIGVANVVSVLHPEMVVLGGSVAGIGSLLFEKVREVVGQRVGMFPTEGVQIEPSLLGDQAGAWGGIALAARGGYPIHRGDARPSSVN
jgi:glucokinase